MNASAQPLIRLNGIKKVFYTDEVETHALAGIHLEIQQGEYVAIAGPSGCGKSTLLAILGLLDTASEGTYTLNGNEVANLSKRDADIAIRGTSKPPEHLVGHHLGRASFALYVSKAIYEAKGREKDPAAYDWIVLDESMPDHPALRWRKKNYPKVTPRYYLGSLLTLGEAVRCGLGVGMMSTFRSKDDPGLQALTPVQDDCGIDIWILAHPESRHLRRIATVYSYFSKVLRFG